MSRTIYNSPIGTLIIQADNIGLRRIDLAKDNQASDIAPEKDENPHIADAVRWLDLYFQGDDPGALPAFHLSGTSFQMKVWEQLQLIPYGKTTSYGAIAKAISGGGKMSAQAVGQAVGANPVCIIIPCHRVLGAGGKLTGYAYGLDMKRALLETEKIL